MSAWLVAALLIAVGQPVPPGSREDEEAQPPPPPAQAPLTPAPGAPAPAATAPAAQPEPDGPAGNQPMDALTRRPVVRPFEMPAYGLPSAPIPYGQIAPLPGAPVEVDRYTRSYETAKDDREAFYDRGVKSHYEAEQALMGPLDGVWTISTASGQNLYRVIINEPGMNTPLEAAWRDLRKPRGPSASGTVDLCARDGQALSIEFQEDDRVKRTSLRLRRASDGEWRGELDDQGRRETVVMTKGPTPS